MNKLTLVTLFLVFALAGASFAQVSLNFSSGYINTHHQITKVENFAHRKANGYFIGVAPVYRLSKKFQVLVDFQYNNQKYENKDLGFFTPVTYKMSFLNIMPEVEYQVHNNIAFGVGLNYGVKLNEESKYLDGSWVKSSEFKLTKSTDFGITGKLKINYRKISAFVRYNVGVKNITNLTFTNNNGDEVADVQQLNRNLQVGVGYTLGFKKG